MSKVKDALIKNLAEVTQAVATSPNWKYAVTKKAIQLVLKFFFKVK